MSEDVGYLIRAIGLPAVFGAGFMVIPLALGAGAKLGRFALAGVAFAIFASLVVEIGSPALVRSLPAGLGDAWGDESLAAERWHQVAFVAAAVLAVSLAGLVAGRAVSGPWALVSRSGVEAIAVVCVGAIRPAALCQAAARILSTGA